MASALKKSKINELKRGIEKFCSENTPEEQKEIFSEIDDNLKQSARKILQKMKSVLESEDV